MRRLLSLAILAASTWAGNVRAPEWSYTPLSNEVTNIEMWKDTTWIGTNHGLYRLTSRDTTWYHPTNSNLPGERILPGLMKIDKKQGDLWVATGHGVSRILQSTGALTTWDSTNNVLGNFRKPATALAVYQGIAFVVTDTGYLNAYFGSDWSKYTVTGRTGPIQSLVMTDSGKIWIGLGSGTNTLGQNLAGVFAPWKNGNDSITSPVRQLFTTGESLWVAKGTPDGQGHWGSDTLFLIPPGGARTAVSNLDAVDGLVTAVRINDPKTATFIAKGSYVYRDFAQSPFGITIHMDVLVDSLPAGGPVATAGVTALAVRSSDSLWLGTAYPTGFNPGLYLPGRTGAYLNHVRGTKLVGQALGYDSALWFATDFGVYRLDQSGSVTLKQAMDQISGIAAGQDSTVIVATSAGTGIRVFGKSGISQTRGTPSLNAIAIKGGTWLHSTEGGFYYTDAIPGSGVLSSYTHITAPYDSASANFLNMASPGGVDAKTGASGTGKLWYAGIRLHFWSNGWHDDVGNATPKGLDAIDTSAWASFFIGSGYSNTSKLMRFSSVPAMLDSFYLATPIGVVLAASDTTAWTYASYGWGYPFGGGASALRKWKSGIGIVKSYTSDSSFLHQGLVANTRNPIVADSAGGFWVVFQDGIQRFIDAGLPKRQQSPTSSVRAAGKGLDLGLRLSGRDLSFRLSKPEIVRLEILGIDGRVLERQNIGSLPTGEHRLALHNLVGVGFLRLSTSESNQTISIARF